METEIYCRKKIFKSCDGCPTNKYIVGISRDPNQAEGLARVLCPTGVKPDLPQNLVKNGNSKISMLG